MGKSKDGAMLHFYIQYQVSAESPYIFILFTLKYFFYPNVSAVQQQTKLEKKCNLIQVC